MPMARVCYPLAQARQAQATAFELRLHMQKCLPLLSLNPCRKAEHAWSRRVDHAFFQLERLSKKKSNISTVYQESRWAFALWSEHAIDP
jgi:hypothetical protein